MCCGKERRHGFWILIAIFAPLAIAAAIFLFGSVVMLLWNALLPSIFGIGTITFWQALGILILAKILFGGFSGGHSHLNSHSLHKKDWHRKWMHLSPEQREKMKAEWSSRCEPSTGQE